MRHAALLIAGAVLLGGCTSEDPPGPSPSTTTASTAATPSSAELDQADQRVRSAIAEGDTAELRTALSAAGTLAGRVAATKPDQGDVILDAESQRDYLVATWWAAKYSADRDFAKVYANGALRPYREISLSSSALQQLSTLAFRVENDWRDRTGDRLSFHDTYKDAFDAELPKP